MRFKNLSDEERIQKFNQIADNNRRKSETGTNGELTIIEYLEKNPEIREALDTGEVVKYIAYKKKIPLGVLLSLFILPMISMLFILVYLYITPNMISADFKFDFRLRLMVGGYCIGASFIYFLYYYIKLIKKNCKNITLTNTSIICQRKNKIQKILYKEIDEIKTQTEGLKSSKIISKNSEVVNLFQWFLNFNLINRRFKNGKRIFL